MRKLFSILLACFMLAGCTQTEVDYERSTEMGVMKEITMEEVLQRVEDKDTFMFVFTQEHCINCKEFKETILYNYILDHGFVFNEVVLSNDMDTKPVFDWVEQHPNPIDQLEEGYLPEDVLTPSFYFIENGEVKDIYIGSKMTKNVLEEMVIKYQLDKVK